MFFKQSICFFIFTLFYMTAHGQAEIKIKQNKPKLTKQKILEKAGPQIPKTPSLEKSKNESPAQPAIQTEYVQPKTIQAVTSSFHHSYLHRTLLSPKDLVDGNLALEYRNLPQTTAMNLLIDGHYTYFDQLEFNLAAGLGAQSRDGVQFGGVKPGVRYQLIEQNEDAPELVTGVSAAFLGTGVFSLSKGNSISIFPEILAQKQVLDYLSLSAKIIAGIGNKSSGLALINTDAITQINQDIDFRLKLDLENLGYPENTIFSISPFIHYHLTENINLSGGVRIGLAGANLLGNNFSLMLNQRF